MNFQTIGTATPPEQVGTATAPQVFAIRQTDSKQLAWGGPWFEQFAWMPRRTIDSGWRWLVPVMRRKLVISFNYETISISYSTWIYKQHW